MIIISKVVRKTQGLGPTEWASGTDLRRRTLLDRRPTPALEGARDSGICAGSLGPSPRERADGHPSIKS
jgi:hypothetical protein